MPEPQPFHAGEIAVQERAGERAVALHNGRIVGSSLAAPHRDFLAAQRTLAVAACDAEGRPWASLWCGAAGFAQSDDDGRRLRIEPPHDPVQTLLSAGAPIGLLAIDLTTRRRLRVNGRVEGKTATCLEVDVHEAFPNCPKYIQRRELSPASKACAEPPTRGTRLDREQLASYARADTLFVASRHPDGALDVSHRGGAPGFVRVVDRATLRIPDYRGNGMFQTLGNFELDPRAGVVLVDFTRRRLLSLTGTVRVLYAHEDAAHPTGGTGRYWEFSVEAWVDFGLEADFGFVLREASPLNPPPFRPSTSSHDP
jgi:predicted pyridoxine 5'-phosphate oxidase superfamily flavin-nucleotide-binding protein